MKYVQKPFLDGAFMCAQSFLVRTRLAACLHAHKHSLYETLLFSVFRGFRVQTPKLIHFVCESLKMRKISGIPQIKDPSFWLCQCPLLIMLPYWYYEFGISTCLVDSQILTGI